MKKKYLLNCSAFILIKEQDNDKKTHSLYKYLISLYRPFCDSVRIQMDCRKEHPSDFSDEKNVCFVLNFSIPLHQIKNVVNIANVLDGICKTIGSFDFVECALFHIHENDNEDGCFS